MQCEPASRITLRLAVGSDARSVWRWRNDPATRVASFDAEPVEYADHERWFAARLVDRYTRIYIIVDPKKFEVGYVRFSMEGDNAFISIALDTPAQGRGIGTAAIVAGCGAILAKPGVDRVTADVKADNEQSKGAFIKAGFGLVLEEAFVHRLEFPPPGESQ